MTSVLSTNLLMTSFLSAVSAAVCAAVCGTVQFLWASISQLY